MIADPASAGHAGEGGPVTALPHELMEAAVILGILGVILIILGLVGLWLLVKIHRRLKDGAPVRHNPHAPPSSTTHDSTGDSTGQG